jgi:hypothetical protein
MASLYNRTAFRPGRLDVTPLSSPLLSSYCRLVSIEMLLKDHLRQLGAAVRNSHDVPLMLANLAIRAPLQTAAINALNTALKANLARLWCEGRAGTQTVPAASYPYIRYIRHDSEYASHCSPETDIQDLESLTQQIQALLFTITGATA